MDDGLIPQRYAKALYKYALEKGVAADLYALSKRVIDSFVKNPELIKVLANPFVDNKDKKELLIAAAGPKPDDAYSRFIQLILDHNRVNFAYEMMLAYRDLYRKENKISQVKITTAATLNHDLMKKLKKLVENSFKDSTLEFTEDTNPDLIGGFVIDVDSLRLDSSVSNELEQLRQTLLKS